MRLAEMVRTILGRRVGGREGLVEGFVQRTELPSRVLVELLGGQQFAAHLSVLREEGKAELNALAERLNGEYASQEIMIEGHTDNTPIKYSGWKDNWELGAQRSLTVLRYLASRGVDEKRLAAATYSYYHPVATNDTAEGRAQNRRSEIAIHTGIERKSMQ